jgi:cytochrome c oxidase cbb3-type subunit 3
MIDPPPTQQAAAPGRSRRRTPLWIFSGALLLVLPGMLLSQHLQRDRLEQRLLLADPDTAAKDPQLRSLAVSQAKPLYAANCARCHGADMQGDTSLGAPNLVDRYWLFGVGTVFDIERTLLYGVRSEQSKSHNVTDMPPFGLTGRLSEAEIRNLVQYLLRLSGQPHQAAAAEQGKAVYQDVAKANCADCHGDTGSGNADYGAPDLTINVWNSGGGARELYDAIYYGQHHIMPGWFGTLSLEQIRALAIYVYAMSHGIERG